MLSTKMPHNIPDWTDRTRIENDVEAEEVTVTIPLAVEQALAHGTVE